MEFPIDGPFYNNEASSQTITIIMEEARENVESSKSFNELPGDCIATILSLSSPSDVCRAAATCSALQLAAAADFVWERFLPLDYQDILSRVADPCLVNKVACSKRDLFFFLCHSLLLDSGRKIIELEKFNGLISYTLSARELSIVWGDDPMYWSWKYTPDSRFAETAELIMTSWLEINGKIKIKKLSPNTNYGAYLLFKVSKRRGFGLDTMPMEISIQVGNNPVCRNIVYLRQDDGQKQQLEWLIYYNRVEMLKSRVIQGPKGTNHVLPGLRYNGWMEIELGRFFSGDHHHGDDHEVKMSLMEIKGHQLKGGLIVEGIEIRPILHSSIV